MAWGSSCAWPGRFLGEVGRAFARLWQIASPNEHAGIGLIVAVVAVVLVLGMFGPLVDRIIGGRAGRLTKLALCLGAVVGVAVAGDYLASRNRDVSGSAALVYDSLRRELR